jgi:RND superfamily putative drug exporter
MGRSLLEALRRPWAVLAAWLLLAAVSMALSPMVAQRLAFTESPPAGSDSARAGRLLKEAFPDLAGSPHVVVVRHPGVSRDDPRLREYLARLRGELGALPGVRTASLLDDEPATVGNGSRHGNGLNGRGGDPGVNASGLGRHDGEISGVLAVSSGSEPAASLVPRLRDAVPRLDPALGQVAVTGPAAAAHDVFTLLGERLGQVERVSLVLSAFALYYVFGGILPVALALVSGLICLAILPSLLFATSLMWPATSVNLVLSAVIALALGLDYPLLFLSRLREEYDGDLPGALVRVRRSAGRTIAVSAMAVGLAGLAVMWVPLGEVRSAGLTMAGAAALAGAASWWLLPALLSLYAARWPLGPRLAMRRPRASTDRLEALVRRVTARPGLALGASLLALSALVGPAFRLETWSPFVSMLPAGLESKRGLDWLQEAGTAGALTPIWVIWEAPETTSAWEPAFLARLGIVAGKLRDDPRIAEVHSPADAARSPAAASAVLRATASWAGARKAGIASRGKVALMRVVARPAPDDRQSESLLAAIRAAIAAAPGPGTATIAGMQAELADIRHAYHQAFPRVASCTVAGVAVMVGVYLRSVLLPFKAILTNALPVLGGLGAAVVVFQWGWTGPWAGVPGEPLQILTVSIVVPLLYALSMDYELFILARIREEYLASGSHREAIVRGLARSGRVVAGAALVMLSVFLPYLFVGIRTMQELGVGLSVAILLDATIVRWVLVPAAMALVGDRNFWLPWSKTAAKSNER